MTSSLVGSEMCIRDSLKSGRRRAAGLELAQRSLNIPVQLAVEAWGVGSVSYTHLTLPTICSV
eukprot:8118551-Prorocentrum_lima.AAC.1